MEHLNLEQLNYEDFYQNILQLERGLKEKLQHTQRCFKSISKDSEKGDIRNLNKNTAEMRSLLHELGELSATLQDNLDNFDSQSYFESGAFTKQMIDYCNQYNVDIQGEASNYEIFPFKLRIDSENQDLYVNRRKVPCMRPLYFVQNIKQNIEKYFKSNFNINQFVNELANAYDLAVIVRNSGSKSPRYEFDVFLRDLYNYMAPTQKARRDYDMQQYAFDLSRLNSSDTEVLTRDGRGFQFGTNRTASKNIRMLDSDGREQYWATIRFFNVSEV